jgi:hypothetical protein
VRAHQTTGIHPHLVVARSIAARTHEHSPVVVVDDDHRLAIAARHRVVHRARELNTAAPGHARRIANNRPSEDLRNHEETSVDSREGYKKCKQWRGRAWQ